MLIEVTQSDLVNMVKGITPSYKAMGHPLVKTNGRYCGGHSDTWTWNSLRDVTEKDLLEIYRICKEIKDF